MALNCGSRGRAPFRVLILRDGLQCRLPSPASSGGGRHRLQAEEGAGIGVAELVLVILLHGGERLQLVAVLVVPPISFVLPLGLGLVVPLVAGGRQQFLAPAVEQQAAARALRAAQAQRGVPVLFPAPSSSCGRCSIPRLIAFPTSVAAASAGTGSTRSCPTSNAGYRFARGERGVSGGNSTVTVPTGVLGAL